MRRFLSTRSLAERTTMATTDAPRPAPPGNNRDLLQALSDDQKAVATGKGTVPTPEKAAKTQAKAAEPTKPADQK